MTKKIYIGLLVVLLVFIALVAAFNHADNPPFKSSATSITGTVKFLAVNAEVITVAKEGGGDASLALDPKSKLFDEKSKVIVLKDIKAGMILRAEGMTTPTSIIVESIHIISRPSGGTDLGEPCPGVINEQNSGISCKLSISSRITLSLPSVSYLKSALSINPSDALHDTFGASTQNERWVRTFQASKAGKVILSVPSKDKSVATFKATLDIFEEASTSTTENSPPDTTRESGTISQ